MRDAVLALLFATASVGMPVPASANEVGPVIADASGAGYVTSSRCRTCHPGHYYSWQQSYHRTMTQRATTAALAPDLEGVVLALSGSAYRFDRDGDRWFVTIERPDRKPQRRRLELTTGSHHRQWLWFETGRGRALAALPFIYLIAEGRFVPRDAAFMHPPQRTWPTSHLDGKWGVGCINCHTTAPRAASSRAGERRAETGEATAAELGIACEACHGPAADHVRQYRNPGTRYSQHLGGEVSSSIVDPSELTARQSSAVCGQCHSLVAAAAVGEFQPGGTLEDHYDRSSLEDEIDQRARWSDGRVRMGGREYDAISNTGCFRSGEMSCLSCHAMHRGDDDLRPFSVWASDQLRPQNDSDLACLQCHEMSDVRAHTHHAKGSLGSACNDCHMPHTSYALLKAIRNHQVAPPSVAETVEAGRPNACNLCHLDRSLGWTAEHLEAWYGVEAPELDPDEQRVAAGALWALRGDAGKRVLLAWHMGWEPARRTSGTDWLPFYLALLLDDPYPAVRYVAWRSLRSLPGYDDLAFDYVAEREHRASVSMQVFERWQATSAPMPKRPAVLLNAGGVPINEDLARLSAERDARVVEWLE